ncbi:MAG TPA: helicase-related protein, partial [Anaerolineae bacterium]|nr:helicase-related protein [Anaerolineae bacterium]
GQHYFLHHVQDFQFFKDAPGGGAAVEDRWFWPRQDALTGGSRLVLTDRLASQSDDVDGDDASGDGDVAPRRSALVYLCRRCGALHPAARRRCDACAAPGELVALLAMQQKEDHPGALTSCLSCGARGRPMGARYREPAREVRAVTVADVHILAQDLVRHAERRRLLVFADNRQDAAFQAGWMRDRARRYRLRALMDQQLRAGPLSVGDLAAALDHVLAADQDLSRTLLPEVWAVYPPEAAGRKHQEERGRYLRIQVLREVTTSFRQRIGLEPWGRLRLRYFGLDAAAPFFVRWAAIAGLQPEQLLDGVSALLDQLRRKSIVKDAEGLFGHIWKDGDWEVQRGYMPLLQGVPKGLKLRRAAADDSRWLDHWLAPKSETTARQQVRRWGVPAERVDDCLGELWLHLTAETRLLVPVTLLGSGAAPKPLAGCSGAYQLDAGHFLLEAHEGLWRCGRCRRTTPRRTPFDRCPAWRCDGRLVFEPEDPDNYDLSLLQDLGAMVRPREHSAQVPHADREQIERDFKGDGDRVNTLVCTPTLELGVDIGALDAVLMRNVPPQAANYWQRVGRAGRRHRMAVNITYARPVSHDRAYYADPLKLLAGRVEPPRFNLRNEPMVARHVHAAVLTGLHRLARAQDGGSGSGAAAILPVLQAAFPTWLRDYLFDADGAVLPAPPDLAPLHRLIQTHRPQLLAGIAAAFTQGWPEADAEVVSEPRLAALIDEMPDRLAKVLRRLRRRLQWALDQIERLTAVRKLKGTLNPEDDAQFSRCDRLVKRLKGMSKKSKAEGEGYEDTYTLGLLAAEGFLPGYGLDVGSILATAVLPRALGADFTLARPPTMALRELVPGNLLYANGHRFVARTYQLAVPEGAGAARSQMLFQVDQAHEAVTEAGREPAGSVAPLGIAGIRAVPVCDVELSHRSQINDEEDYRFQLPVAVYGLRQGRHDGGQAYLWGAQALQHLRGARFRLVNVGPATAQAALGYPVCLVCGQCASPFASAREREHFDNSHLERCGQRVQPTGFYADVVAHALILPSCVGREEAYSVLEALRIGAANVLEMERDDLNLLVMGKAGQDAVEAALYDPMPGGSGLLDQLLE